MAEPRRLIVFASVVLVAVSAACTKVPLFAPTGSSITLSATRTTAPLNTPITITAVVQESAGTATQNGTLVTFSSNLGTFDPAEARTNGGRVMVTYNTGTQSGTAVISATSGAAKTASTGETALKIVIGAAAAKSLVVTLSATTVRSSGGSVDITAVVLDDSGNRLGGVPVTFSTSAGTLSASSVVSDAAGAATSTLTTTAKATITATVTGSGATAVSGTATVDVRPGPSVTLTTPSTGAIAGSVPTSFTVTPATGTTPTVSLTFGDGTSQSLGAINSAATISKLYSAAGTYTITATLMDANGDTGSASTSVTVAARPAPKGQIDVSPASPSAGQATTVTVTPDTGNSGGTTVSLDFGDGTTQSLGTVAGSKAVTHTYSSAGTYTVTATFTDGFGSTGSASKGVIVTARLVNTVKVLAASSQTLGTATSFTVTVTAPSSGTAAPVSSVKIDFGDGNTVDLGALPIAETTVLHTYTAPGSYQVRATLTDTAGGTSTSTTFVSIPLSVTLSFTPSNPTITTDVTFTALTPGFTGDATYTWDFGDGRIESTSSASTTHRYAKASSTGYTAKVTVRTSSGTSATSSNTVTVIVSS